MDRNKEFYELMNIINGVYDKMGSYRNNSRQYGTDDFLYMIEAHTIDIIGSSENITASEIAKKMFKTKGAVSQTIEKLLDKQLIEKNVHPSDSRKNILSLTEKGDIVYRFHREKDKIAYDRYLERLNEYDQKEFETCRKILAKIFKLDDTSRNL